MTERLTKDVIVRTNEQRRRLGRPMMSMAGFEHAVNHFAFNHAADALVVSLVNWVLPHDRPEFVSAYEVPKEASELPEGRQLVQPRFYGDEILSGEGDTV